MDEKPDAGEDRYKVETDRLAKVLAFLVKGKPASVRSLEQKMGVGDSVFAKVLKSKITLNVRHILMICDALGIEWSDFFAQAYGLGGKTQIAVTEDAQFELKVRPILIDLLIQLGLLPPEAAKVKTPESEQPPAVEPPLAGEDQPSPPKA